MPQTSSTPEAPTELANALVAVEKDPGDETLWDAAEDVAAGLEQPEALAELYAKVLAGGSAPQLADRALRFTEEWFGDDAPQAQEVLLQVFAREPSDEALLERLAMGLSSAGRWETLMDVYDRAVDATDSLEGKASLLQEASRVARDVAEDAVRAAGYLERLLVLRPEDVGLRQNLQRLLEKGERWHQLITLWESGLPALAGEASAKQSVAMANCWLDHLHNPPAAVDVLVEAAKLHGDQAEVCGALERVLAMEEAARATRAAAFECVGGLYAGEAHREDRARVVRVALAFVEDAEKVSLLNELIGLLVEGGSRAEALGLLGELLVLTPDDEALADRIGNEAGELGEQAAHVVMLEQAAEAAAPPRRDGLRLRAAAVARGEEGMLDRALSLFERVFREGNDAESRRRAGDAVVQIRREHGGIDERSSALSRLAEVTEDADAKAALLGELAELSTEHGDHGRALATWQARLERDPDDTRALDGLIEVQRAREDWPELVMALRRRLQRTEQLDEQAADLARIASVQVEQLGDLAAGLATWRRLSELGVESEPLATAAETARQKASDAYKGATDLQASVGRAFQEIWADPAAAVEHFSRALRMDPTDSNAIEGLTGALADEGLRGVAAAALGEAYAKTGSVEGELSLVAARVAEEDSAERRRAIWLRAARLSENRQSDPAAAFASLCEAFLCAPAETGIDDDLARLAQTTGEWARYADTLSVSSEALGDGSRARALREREAQVRAEHTDEAVRAGEIWLLLHGTDAAREDLAVAAFGSALVSGSAAVAAEVFVGHSRANGAAKSLAKLIEGSEDAPRADFCASVAMCLADDSPGDAKLARALNRQLAGWAEQWCDDGSLAEQAWARAAAIEPHEAGILEGLAAHQRRQPGVALHGTLVALAPLAAEPLGVWREAASVALETLADDALAKIALETLLELARSPAQRLSQPDAAREAAVWAVTQLAAAAERAGDAAALLHALSVGAALEPAGDDTLGFGRRAAEQALATSEDPLAAITAYERLFAQRPDDAETTQALVDLYGKADRPQDALVVLRRALEACTGLERRSQLRLLLAETSGRLEERDLRVTVLRDNLRDQPGHAESLDALEGVLRGRGTLLAWYEVLVGQAAQLRAEGNAEAARDLFTRAASVGRDDLSDTQKQLDALGQVVDIAPTEEVIDAIAAIHERSDDTTRAVPWLVKLLELAAPEARARGRLRLASVYEAADDWSAAADTLREGCAEQPSAQGLRDALAELYERNGELAKLADLLADAARHTEDGATMLGFARRAAELYCGQLQTPERSVDVLQRAVAEAPDDHALKCLYADGLMAAGRLDRARELLEEMVAGYGRRRSPERAELHLRLARVATHAEDTAAALEQLDLASGMSRGDVSALRMLAQLAEEAGEWDRAEKALRSLLLAARRPHAGQAPIASSQVLFSLHRVANARGQEDKAEELLTSALETAAESEQESDLLRGALLESGRPELLLRVLEMRLAAVTDASVEARVLADLAGVLEGPLNRPDEALDARLKAIAAAPTLEDLHDSTLDLALRLEAHERYFEAVQAQLERARRKEDGESAGWLGLRLGQAHERRGVDPSAAKDSYARVESGCSAYVAAQLGVARIAGQMGSEDEERTVLEALVVNDAVDADSRVQGRYRLLELSVAHDDQRDAALDGVQQLLAEHENYALAAGVLEHACVSAPEDGRAQSLYEEVVRASKDGSLLLGFFERHATTQNPSLELLREGASLARERGLTERAAALYQRAATLAEDGGGLADALWALSGLSALAKEAGDAGEAIRWLRKASDVAEGEDGFQLGIELAQLAASSEQAELAIETYSALREREPADPRVFRPLLALHKARGDVEAARSVVFATVESLLDAEERNELRVQLAEMCFAAKQGDMAEEALRAALEDDPDAEQAALMLADHLEREGRREDLADLLSRKLESARDRRSQSIVPLSLRMGTLLEETRPDDAVQIYKTALDVVPDDSGLLRAAVDLMDPVEQAAERVPLVESLLEREPGEDGPQLALWLLDQAAQGGDEAAVERAMNLGNRVAPENEALRGRLELWYRERKDWPNLCDMLQRQAFHVGEQEALEMLREAAQIALDHLSDPARAAELLRDARVRAPSDRELLRLAALAGVRAGDVEAVLADVQSEIDGAKRKKDRVAFRLLKAEALGEADRIDEAVAELELAYADGGVPVAALLLEGLNTARARAERDGDADRERDLLMRCLEVADAGDGLAAPVPELTAYVQRHPDDVLALRELLERQVSEEAWAEVTATATRIIEVADADAVHDASQRLVAATREQAQPAGAVGGLERALARFESDDRLAQLLGDVYEAIGADAALAKLLLARMPSEGEPDARFETLRRAGRLMLNAGEVADALPLLTQALELRSDDHATLLYVADAYIDGGNFEQAQALLQTGMDGIRARRSPELAQLRHRMAKLSERAGDEDARYEWLTVALEADMNNGEIASETAALAQALGKFDHALKALRAVTMIKGECPMGRAEAFLRQAQIVLHKGEKRRAALWAKKAKAEDPEFPGIAELFAEIEG